MTTLSPAAAAAIARLRSYVPPPTTWYSLPLSRRAAVLILLFADKKGDLRVVLTMRANTLRNYAGQAALPGGKSDSLTETPLETARREAHEEIGLPLPSYSSSSLSSVIDETKYSPETPTLPYPYRLEHLCQMPTNLAKTSLGVRACVAYLYATSPVDRNHKPVDTETMLIPRLDAREVAAVFTAPFHNFLRTEDEGQGRGVKGNWYEGMWIDWHETKWRMHNFYVPIIDQIVTRPRSPRSSKVADSTLSADTDRRTSPSTTNDAPFLPYSDIPSASTDPLASLSRFRVFGMTARLLVDCARVAYAEEPQFEHNSHFGDESVIRRLVEIGELAGERKGGEEFGSGDVAKLLQGEAKRRAGDERL